MRRAPFLGAIALFACDGESGMPPLPLPLQIPAGCNPLAADADCLLPYPSDFFLGPDGSADPGEAGWLHDGEGNPVPFESPYAADGWSVGTQILALFPGGVDPEPLVFHTGDVTASLGDDSPTLLLEADGGARILHFAELDPRAPDDSRRALVLRPLVRLKNATRHVVAIHGLRDRSGAPVPAPEGFRRIRDGETSGDPVLGPVADRFEREVFPVLEESGVERPALQLAWDFTTRTEEDPTRDMLAIREDLLARIGRELPVVTVTDVADDVDEHTFRRIYATVRVPLYLESPEPGARLLRDDAGAVVANGTAEVPVTILIPRSVVEPGGPQPRILQFGHGFFGTRAEVEDNFVYEFADRFGFVVVAADWWGMSQPDLTPLLDALSVDLSSAFLFTDRVHQAMANFIAVAEAVRGTLLDLPELQVGRAREADRDHVYYYGISNGHILGGTYAALSPRVERATLGCGGADYSLIMFRAHPFAAFLFVIGIFVPDALDLQKFGALSQATFDRIDPLTYAPHLLADPYPGSPDRRRVLMQIGIGDAEVPNLASHLHARALGLRSLAPAPREIAGIETVEAPAQSAIVELDFGIDPLPGIEAIPPGEPNEVHEAVRRLDAGMRQVDAFFRPDGRIEATCDGVCDPE